jgi:hypothetical protein
MNVERVHMPPEPLPEEYWGLRAEAELLVGLTTADTTVGMIAGGWLEHVARAEAERDEVRRSMIADFTAHAERKRKAEESGEAPGPDGVICGFHCDAWTVDYDCPQHGGEQGGKWDLMKGDGDA